MISTRPTQKVGRLKPRIEPAMIARPTNESGFSPRRGRAGCRATMAITIADEGELERRGQLVEDQRGWPGTL